MDFRLVVLVAFVVSCLVACKKESEQLVPEAIKSVGQQIRINDIQVLSSDVWIACGGVRNGSGYFFRSEDAGNSWQSIKTIFPRSLYCIDFLDSLNGIAGGDYLDLWKTNDGGRSWDFQWLGDQVPFNEEDRPGIRNISMLSDSNWYFCGGENFGEGVIYRSTDAGQLWQFEFDTHEYRGLDFFESGEGVVGGYGNMLVLKSRDLQSETTDFTGDFITALKCLDNQKCIGVSYTGVIYESIDGGLHWQVLDKPKNVPGRRVNWNALDREGDFIVVVGNSGAIAKSEDMGQSWQYETLKSEPDLFSVQLNAGKIIASSDDGVVYVIGW